MSIWKNIRNNLLWAATWHLYSHVNWDVITWGKNPVNAKEPTKQEIFYFYIAASHWFHFIWLPALNLSRDKKRLNGLILQYWPQLYISNMLAYCPVKNNKYLIQIEQYSSTLINVLLSGNSTMQNHCRFIIWHRLS